MGEDTEKKNWSRFTSEGHFEWLLGLERKGISREQRNAERRKPRQLWCLQVRKGCFKIEVTMESLIKVARSWR